MPVEIGLLVAGPSDESGAQAIAALSEYEGAGIDALWLRGRVETTSATLLHAAALADATRRIRIGIAAPPSAIGHPLRLAEDLATLDVASGGRLDWAPLRDPAEDAGRHDERLEIVLTAWRGEPFSHRGAHWQLPELVCVPRPARRPHPILWLDAGAEAPSVADPAATRRFSTWSNGAPEDVGPRPCAWVCRPEDAQRAAGARADWLIVEPAADLGPGLPEPDAVRRLVDSIRSA